MIDKKPKERKTVNKKKETTNWFPIFVGITQAVAAIATVIMAFLAWQTLLEMQAERNNAYRPEIVVMPHTFESELVKVEEFNNDETHMYLDYNAPNPENCYTEEPTINKNYLYLEKPYITLKNIGQGTAKDVTVSFSAEWQGEVLKELNREEPWDDYSYDYYFGMKQFDLSFVNIFEIMYLTSKNSNPTYVLDCYVADENIPYIASGDNVVNMDLPEGWCHMLGLIFDKKFRTSKLKEPSVSGSSTVGIPNLVITIQYSDMQGESYTEEEVIPWSGHFEYETTEGAEMGEVGSISISTSFYKNYINSVKEDVD